MFVFCHWAVLFFSLPAFHPFMITYQIHVMFRCSFCLGNKFYAIVPFSSANLKSNSVATVARNNLLNKVRTSWAEDMGRILTTSVEFNGRKITLSLQKISAYALNVLTALSTIPLQQKC